MQLCFATSHLKFSVDVQTQHPPIMTNNFTINSLTQHVQKNLATNTKTNIAMLLCFINGGRVIAMCGRDARAPHKVGFLTQEGASSSSSSRHPQLMNPQTGGSRSHRTIRPLMSSFNQLACRAVPFRGRVVINKATHGLLSHVLDQWYSLQQHEQ